MPKAIRQENLYGAEDWTIVYTSFKNAEFTSYDFDTLRNSMIDYMQVNYPEEFNDYIQNSEFIALLDLVAYVGQNLAFRMDLNARENILDTAEKRESVLRIARMLSYKPKRIRPAQGFLRVTSIVCSDQIIDSTGVNLSNKTVTWGSDPSELEYDRFIKIMNAAFQPNNKFGTPVKRSVNNTTSNIYEIYQFTNTNLITNYPVNVNADGVSLNFDILPIDISNDGFITQVEPDLDNVFSVMYRNDGKGVGSTKTGFFFLAKQGYIKNEVEFISNATANAVINLPQTTDISEEDFYVQTVDEAGAVLKTWTRVSNLDFSNIALNEYSRSNKDIFEVVYNDNDITSVKFGDGTFTNIPTGYIRVWYRLAENEYIKVKAGEIFNTSFTLTYSNEQGQTHYITFNLELQDDMVSGLPAETLEEIKQNAPEAFYSKNRVVTGDDYNGFLPTLNNNVLVMKAENRTFSGHTRHVDLKDPTGRNRPLIEYADDGYLYSQEGAKNFNVPDDNNRRTVDLLDEHIESKLSDISLLNFYYGKLDLEGVTSTTLFPLIDVSEDVYWSLAYSDATSSNGYIKSDTDIPLKLGFTTGGDLRCMRPGSFVKFIDGTDYYWAAVLDIKGDGLGLEDNNLDYTGLLANGMGPVELNKVIEDELQMTQIIPAFPRVFDDTTRAILLEKLQNNESFAVKFDNQEPKWTVIPDTVPIDLSADFDISDDSTAWVIAATRTSSGYTITIRQLDYIFGSVDLIRFYNINFASSFNPSFPKVSKDDITIIGLNSSGKMVDEETYRISGYYIEDDGYTDQSKVKVTPLDLDNDFLPDDPRHFLNIVENNTIYLTTYEEAEFSYTIPTTTPTSTQVPGKMGIPFRWNHVVEIDQTLNPSLTNIIDVYVLTKTYNDEFTVWKKRNDVRLNSPLPPTTEELRSQFRNLLSYKMMTDEVIFHPAKFKELFGLLAEPEFQAQFKVVKNPKSKLTDSEIKSKVIDAVDIFFSPGNFGFGEIFYFTELAAYIHTSLSTDLNSVVIVPVSTDGRFGTLFQIQPDRNEIVNSVATVNDVIVINEITDSNIRIGR
jgi:hypothetical protein